jgi:Transglycosylase SLT domain
MPVKKIVELDFQSNFPKLMEEFNKYTEAMSKQPEIWAETNKESAALGEGFKTMTALMLAQSSLAAKIAAENKKTRTDSESAAFSWMSMARSTKSVHGNIVAATRQLEKWTGIFTMAGLVSGGTFLWGFDKLAAGAGAGRREATGLGLSYGEQRAFGVTYGRFVDSNTLLRGVSTARADVASPEARAMYALGMVPGQSGDTAAASLETLKRVRALAQRTDDSMLGTVSHAYGIDALGYGPEEMRRLKGASDKDLQAEAYKKRITDFGVTDKALKDMQEFDMILESAGIKIKSTFIEALSPLSKDLGVLTESLSDAAKQLIGSQGFKDAIDWVAKELRDFGVYVGKPEFKQDLKDLADGVAYAAHKIVDAARWMGIIPDKDTSPTKPKSVADAVGSGVMNAVTLGLYDKMMKAAYAKQAAGGADSGLKYADGTPIVDSVPPGYTPMSQGGVDTDLIRKLEGSPDINGKPQTSPAGAVGEHQIMAETARGLGFSDADRYDPVKNKAMAQKLIDELNARYHGNRAEVLAAYNAGPTVGDYLRDHGDRELPRGYGETQGYLHRAGIEVTINNNTGGSAVTTVANGGGVNGIGTPGPSIVQ